jgi:hypothetical protein
VPLGGAAPDVLVASSQVWTSADGRLIRIDPASDRAYLVAREVAGFATDGDDVWAAVGGNRLVRLDGATGAQERSFRLARSPLFAVGDAGFPVLGWGSVWLTVPKLGQEYEPQTLWRIGSRGGRVLAKLPIGVNPTPPLAAFGSIFLLYATPPGQPNLLARLDRGARALVAIATPGSPWARAAGGGSLWVGGRFDPVVWRLDPRTARSAAAVDLPEPARALTFARGSLWATTHTSLLRVDPARNRLVRRIRLFTPRDPSEEEAGLRGIAYAGGSLWISVIAAAARR